MKATAFVSSLTDEPNVDGHTDTQWHTASVPPTSQGWSVESQLITLNMRIPEIRTDNVFPTGIPVSVSQAGIENFSSIHFFTYLLGHEVRHAWQDRILVRSGAEFVDYQALQGFPDEMPFNDNDFEYFVDSLGVFVTDTAGHQVIDCLPERSVLSVGEVSDLGAAILDTHSNVEFGSAIAGERPKDVAEVDNCRNATDTARIALERDAIRFGRTLESMRIPGSGQ